MSIECSQPIYKQPSSDKLHKKEHDDDQERSKHFAHIQLETIKILLICCVVMQINSLFLSFTC
jgi:hypothetical protein